MVGGSLRSTSRGPFLQAERRVPLDRLHGTGRLAEAIRHSVPLRGAERGNGGRVALSPRDALFLDTETTGLAGGTGTVAFLVGTGRVESDDLVIRQYGIRDYPEEDAMLEALAEDLADHPLVTFNGRTFDWPLLVTRFRMKRIEPAPRAHLDLLVPARRLWARSLASHRLGALEREVLGFVRKDDLPSELVPQAYFDYLRTGDPREVARAFVHNADDVISMVALMGRIARVLDGTDGRRDTCPGDAPSTARLLLDLDRPDDALACLEDAADRAGGDDLRRVLEALAHQYRRTGVFDRALACFERLATLDGRFHLEAHEHVAKLLEHRRRDYEGALVWVERALEQVPRGSRAEEALRHREARLRRRRVGKPA